jgi:glycosidase
MKRFTFIVVVLLTLSPGARAGGEYEHEFVFKPPGTPSRVNVAGTFNGWSMDATPMTRGEDGTWRAKVNINEGVHHYKFVVDGNQWLSDPGGDKSLEVDDNHDGKNSGILVGPDARKAPPPKPNAINREFIVFKPDAGDVNVVSDSLVRLRVRAQAGDVEGITVHFGSPDANSKWQDQPMHRMGEKLGLESFACLLNTNEKNIKYVLKLRDGSEEVTYTPSPNGELPFALEMKPAFATPDWAKHAVWYQIFPERFRNGDSTNDPGDKDYEHLVPWTSDWWKPAPGETPGEENFYKGEGSVWKRRYGGDVQGLIESLPYLKKLGINAIYLNPIFEADSMHKYDTSDFRHVDDNFGVKGDLAEVQGETDDPSTWKWSKTDKLFLDFVAKAHEQGFKVIIDGVFNHVGKSHPFFQDVLKNGKSSKYADWFEVTDWESNPIKYKAWDQDNGHLPVFKKDAARGLAKGPYDHVFAITKRWLAPDGDISKGVDGWRLDVPGDIPHPFWIEWRKHVKGINPDAYISGEIWPWAQPWLKGDQFDAVMNYRWADAAQKFFVNQKTAIEPSEFSQYLTEIAYNYPFQIALVQQNLFDSHDTDRFASMFVNPDLQYDAANRIQDNGPKYKPDKPTPLMYKRMRQAIAAQIGFVGAPMLYYGTEAGMWSPDDPSNRMPMVWEGMKFDDPQVRFDEEQFAFVQRAIAVRHQLKPLRLGFFHAIVVDDANDVYAFQRDLGEERAYVVINRSDQARTIKLPVADANGKVLINWLDMDDVWSDGMKLTPKVGVMRLGVSDGTFPLKLGPYESAILSQY